MIKFIILALYKDVVGFTTSSFMEQQTNTDFPAADFGRGLLIETLEPIAEEYKRAEAQLTLIIEAFKEWERGQRNPGLLRDSQTTCAGC